MAIARKIHIARKRSSQPRALKADILEVSTVSSGVGCFSVSEVRGEASNCGSRGGDFVTSSEGRTFGILIA